MVVAMFDDGVPVVLIGLSLCNNETGAKVVTGIFVLDNDVIVELVSGMSLWDGFAAVGFSTRADELACAVLLPDDEVAVAFERAKF